MFLDGFDEIGIKHKDRNVVRTDFLNALKNYIQQTNKHKIVLCSRITEYKQADKYKWKYIFSEYDAQIIVKPISENKIKETLEKASQTGKHKEEARELLDYFNKNEKIKEVISTPFYFNAILYIIN